MPHPGHRRVDPDAGRPSPARDRASRTPETLREDEQALLTEAVRRLGVDTGSELVAAWARRDDGTAYVAAAAFETTAPPAVDEACFAAAAALPGATRLEGSQAPECLVELFDGHAAAVPVKSHDGSTLAVLVCATQQASGLRPRSLAALDARARQLSGPLAAARAAGRLAALDAEIRRLDRLSALGTLAAEIAHEVRNPLVSVKTFLQLLPERRDDPEFATGFLRVASQELQRVERLLDLVIEYPRDRDASGSAAPGEAFAAVAELLRHLTRARGVQLECEVEDPLPHAALGPDGLRQLLLNLALNALGVTPEGGRVRIGARATPPGVELWVADQGPGVPEGERGRVFEPFHSTRSGAHGGLGLAICRRIVEEAGGRIQVEDAAPRGAVFRVWLPAAERSPETG
jgi:signal transduction histidine kinase